MRREGRVSCIERDGDGSERGEGRGAMIEEEKEEEQR